MKNKEPPRLALLFRSDSIAKKMSVSDRRELRIWYAITEQCEAVYTIAAFMKSLSMGKTCFATANREYFQSPDNAAYEPSWKMAHEKA